MAEGNGNGNGRGERPTATLTLKMDLLTHSTIVEGSTPNVECALSMLAAATRAFEAQLRQQQAIEFAARAQQAQQAENVRRMISKS